jgi:predicted dienelactone hydrolase
MSSVRLAFTVAIATVLASCVRPEPAQREGPDLVGLRPDAPVYAKHGPFWVGTRDFRIDDATRPIPLTVWYPALNPNGAKEEITYTDVLIKWDAKLPAGKTATVKGHAIKDAAVERSSGPYPLILFSHGLGDSRVAYAYLTEHLASQGFVVIAPDHTEWWADDLPTLWKDSILRPQDILRVIAYAESLTGEKGALRGLIDVQHIGIAGHSYGGYTALAAGGARFALDEFNAFCAALAKGDPVRAGCTALVRHETDMAALAGLQPMPQGLWPPARTDSRIRAVAALAPGSPLFGNSGLTTMRVPLLAMGGSADTEAPPEWGLAAYEHASSQAKALVVFENAAHMLFGATCHDEQWFADVGHSDWCSDAVWDMNRAHDLINHFTTAFMLDVLKGNKDAHTALLPDAVKFTGLQYKTTMK